MRQMARERFPDDELAAEIAAREAFDAEEMAAYAANLDAAVEEQDVLEEAHAAMSHGADEPPDDDDFLAQLSDDAKATEAAAEQRALMTSFETKSRDESAQRFMVVERRVAAAGWQRRSRLRASRLTTATWQRRGRRWRQQHDGA
jgi:hypothetical protein